MTLSIRLLAGLLVSWCCSMAALAATPEEDVQQYIAIFQGDTSRHSKAVEDLAWKGLSDPSLFDLIEKRVRDERDTASSREDKDRVAHYVRALGFSGQPKYQPILQEMTGKGGYYNRYAMDAQINLQQHKKWNPVISNRASFDPKYSDDVNRVMNMLRSDDVQLKKLGAKCIYFRNHDDVLLELLAKNVKEASEVASERADRDAIDWMVKSLALVGKEKYGDVLRDIASNRAANPYAREYAKRMLVEMTRR